MDRFGFIAHPVDLNSFYDFLGPISKIARLLPERTVKSLIAKLPPYELCHFERIRSSAGSVIGGNVVTIPLLPIQIALLPEEQVLNTIEKAIRLCEKKGARVVGLGAFTSVVGNEGEVLSRRVDVPITSGNSLTASLALDGIERAASLMGIALHDATAAVIGATGDIGSICTKVLSKKVKQLNIAARNEKKLQEFAARIRTYGKANVTVYQYTKDAVKDAQIILSATSAISTVITPEILMPGAVVCDVAMPANIAREVVSVRDDILVFEGGLATLPHLEDVKNEKLARTVPAKGIYGCIAETMALTFAGKFESFSIGRGNITEEKIVEIKTIAATYGITLSDFFCGYKFFTNDDIAQIRKKAEKKVGSTYAAQR